MINLRLSRRGQITIVDMVLAPIAAIVLAIIAASFLQTSTANLITAVNQEPSAIACNFALNSLYGSYYVHTAAALNLISLYYPDQYQTAQSNQESQLYANCGTSCNLGYSVLSSSLTNFSSLYSDFINYFSSFSFSTFNGIKNANIITLNNAGMSVYLNQIPSSISASTLCQLQVYNPEDPSKPYTIYGVMS
jgi:hypothetical protein